MGQKYYKLAREILETNRSNVLVPLFEERNLISSQIFTFLSIKNMSFDIVSSLNEPTTQEIQSVAYAIGLIIEIDHYYFK